LLNLWQQKKVYNKHGMRKQPTLKQIKSSNWLTFFSQGKKDGWSEGKSQKKSNKMKGKQKYNLK